MSAVYLQQFPSYSNHNCKKLSFLRTPAFICCLPWGCPCGNHAKRCMNEKTIQCLPNHSQHVPVCFQYFPSYTMLKSMRKSKNRYFTTFLFPLGQVNCSAPGPRWGLCPQTPLVICPQKLPMAPLVPVLWRRRCNVVTLKSWLDVTQGH